MVWSFGSHFSRIGYELKKNKSQLTSFTSMLPAPASSEFSISSFTAELTDVMTWELAISFTVDGGKRFIVQAKKFVFSNYNH